MSLLETDIFGATHDKVATAIDRIKCFEPPEGYWGATSFGKDSIVIMELAKRAGVGVEWHYSLTTVDPPELIRFGKQNFPFVHIDRPSKTMWRLIVENGIPPLRQQRYCCRILKERGGEGRKVLTGIRWAESNRRAKRKSVEACFRDDRKFYINPIIEWSDADVWEFIRSNNLPYCSLYDEGWKRLGCVCCPNANQKQQAERWPKIANSYRRACIRAYDKAIADGKARTWKDGNEMFEWWISGAGNSKDPDQSVMFE